MGDLAVRVLTVRQPHTYLLIFGPRTPADLRTKLAQVGRNNNETIRSLGGHDLARPLRGSDG
jgi:hypothetical protein